MPLLMKSFLANHYAIKDLNAEINNQVVDQMIKRLDPSKTLLYDSDVQNLRPVLRRAFSSMQSGDCALLKPVYDLLVTRARENEKIIRRILGSNYRIDEDAELYIDVKKRPYVKTAAEKYDLLKKVVQFQIENDLLSGVTLAEAKKQQVHRYELQTARVLERRPEKLIEYAAEAFAQALDPHTNYLSPDNLEDLKIHMQLSLEGIGALLSSDNGFTVIEELIPGGSAEKSGLLKPKDKIIAVAQKRAKPVNVIDMDLRDVVKMIRGKKGTQVTLMILRQSERTYRFDITLTRDKVYIKDQEAKVDYQTRMVNGKKYSFAVIDLPSFYGDEKENKSSYEDVRALLMEARQRGVHQEAGHAGPRSLRLVVISEDQRHVGNGGVGNECFGSVENPAVPVFHGGRLDGRGVGAGFRFGEAKTADDFPFDDAGKIFFLLLFGAEQPQRHAEQAGGCAAG